MPTPTYDLIASNVLTSSASSVTFSSIPATYRDLVLVVTALNTTGNANSRVRFNSNTGTNYNIVTMGGNGSTTQSAAVADADFLRIDSFGIMTSTDRQIILLNIMDYSATDKHKSTLSRDNNASQGVTAIAGRWASTSAINAIEVFTSANNYASGSTFYLYGIVS